MTETGFSPNYKTKPYDGLEEGNELLAKPGDPLSGHRDWRYIDRAEVEGREP